MRVIERRFSNVSPAVLASAGTTGATGRTVRGYAAVFNSRSELLRDTKGPFYEEIVPGAFDGRLTDTTYALLNHNDDMILARTKGGKGTLQLGVDGTGLWYSFEAPNTNLGNDLLELLRRGDIDRSSFAFLVAPGGDSFASLEDGIRLRTVRKLGELIDISVVGRPAYTRSSATVRDIPTQRPSRPQLVPAPSRLTRSTMDSGSRPWL
jgi:HK97 family phage prohead protease